MLLPTPFPMRAIQRLDAWAAFHLIRLGLRFDMVGHSHRAAPETWRTRMPKENPRMADLDDGHSILERHWLNRLRTAREEASSN